MWIISQKNGVEIKKIIHKQLKVILKLATSINILVLIYYKRYFCNKHKYNECCLKKVIDINFKCLN